MRALGGQGKGALLAAANNGTVGWGPVPRHGATNPILAMLAAANIEISRGSGPLMGWEQSGGRVG